MKIVIITLLFSSIMALQVATVTCDFNSGLGAGVKGILLAGDVVFTSGNNVDANSNQNAERGWYNGDSSGDDMFFISARSSDNKGITDVDLDMTTGSPSHLSFFLNPASGNKLDFSTASLSVDTVLYRDDAIASFNHGIQNLGEYRERLGCTGFATGGYVFRIWFWTPVRG